MNNHFFTALLLFFFGSIQAQNTKTMDEKQVKETISAFAVATDARQTEEAARYLDENFRVVLYNFMNSGKVTVIPREQYLAMMKEGKVGGQKREVEFLLTDINHDAATVKVKLTSDVMEFTNYYSLLRIAGTWKIVNDVPQIVKL